MASTFGGATVLCAVVAIVIRRARLEARCLGRSKANKSCPVQRGGPDFVYFSLSKFQSLIKGIGLDVSLSLTAIYDERRRSSFNMGTVDL